MPELAFDAQTPVAERLEVFQQAASEAFAPLRLAPEDLAGFDGRINYAQAGRVLVADITTTAGAVQRTPKLITSTDTPLYKVSLHLSGHGILYQDDRQCVLKPGDLVVYDTTRPYGLVYGSDYRTVVLGVPQEFLATSAEAVREACALPVSCEAGLARVVAGFLGGMVEDLEGSAVQGGNQLADSLVGLLGKVFTGSAERLADPRTTMRERVLAYCEANLTDPDLCVESVALAHGISVRYLHKLFAETDTTMAAWIRGRRLEHIRRDLIDPSLAGRTVAAVAAHWGVLDPTHLSRVFRSAFGVSPSGYRRAVTGC
ncbi:helix-turn-helix domain-containing protein [Kutzneria viridogrisea]|uniref:HTH araC/xylS-type domain-containing protein n=2 Tax=Kutzneria TaxID=43356 RepID=W5WJR2_9PSEU|nr:helix-turn-helix domain-containing protein [Kutzneria albida]AHI01103.1 hypothetical protein KALB_7745 [Kutzneria albida DSM 43870]MBA8926358.1 AraC-like DNA-binding protein [Kutzneria viridogrisea]